MINSNTIENNIYSKYNKLKSNKFNISNSYYDTNDTNPYITYSFHTNSNLKNRLQSAKYFSLKKNDKNKNNNNQFITLNNRPNSSLNPNLTYRNKIMVYDIYTNKLLKKQEEINKKHYNEKFKNIGTETVEINKNNTKKDNKTNNKNVKNNNINNSNSNDLNFSLISNKDKNDYSIFLYKFNNKNFIKDFSKKIINNKKNLNKNNNHQLTSNKFMKEILKNIYRKIEYLNQKNEIVYEDKVMNLLESEYKEINKNIDLQMEAYCNIKNFSALVNNEIQNNKNTINDNESYLVPFINNIIAPFYEKQKKLISPFITNSNEGNLIQKNDIKYTINNDLEYEKLKKKDTYSIDEINLENKSKKNILTKEKLDTIYNAYKLKSNLILDKEQKNINDSNLDDFNDDKVNNYMKKNVKQIFGLSLLEKNFKIFENYRKNKIGIKQTTSHFNFHRYKYYLNRNKIKFNSSYDKFKMNVLHNKINDIAYKLIDKNKKSKFDKYKTEILLPFFGNLKISSRDLIKDLFSGKTRNANYEKNLRNKEEENKKIDLINEEKNFNIKLEEEKKLDKNEYSSSIKKIKEEIQEEITNEKEEKKYYLKRYATKFTRPIKIDTDIDNVSKQSPTTNSTKYSSRKYIKYSYTQNNLNKKSKIENSKKNKNYNKKKEDFEIFEKNSSSSENSIILNVNNQENKKTKILSKSSLTSNNKSDSKQISYSKTNSNKESFVKKQSLNKNIKRKKRHSLTERTQKQIEDLKKSENVKDINLNTYKPNLDLYESSDSIDSDDLENLTLNKNKYIKNYNKYLKELTELYKDELNENSDSEEEEESVKEKKGILKKNNNVHKNKHKITFKDSKNEENNLKNSPKKNENKENNEIKSEKKSVPLKFHIKFTYNKSKSQVTRDILRSLRGNYKGNNIDNEKFDIEEYRIIKNLLKEKRKEKKNIILKKESVKDEKNENKNEENEENKKEEDFREKYIRAKKQRDSVIKINWEELEKDDDDDDYGFFHKITEKDEESYEENESENKSENENKEFKGRKKIKIKTFKMKNNKAFDNFLKMIQKLKEYNIEEYMKQFGQKNNDKENPKEFNEQQERINKFRENLINNMDQNEVKRKIRSNHCYAEDYENIIGNKLV